MHCKSLVLIFSICWALTLAKVKFTNVKCEELDSKFYRISKCQLNIIKRGVTGLDIYAQLLQEPVNNITLKASFFKKANGYRPFLYKVEINFCDYMKNKKKYPIVKFVVDILNNYSNINHTCPYQDIIIHNMTLIDDPLKHLPVPVGEYMIQAVIYAYNEARLAVKAYFQVE